MKAEKYLNNRDVTISKAYDLYESCFEDYEFGPVLIAYKEIEGVLFCYENLEREKLSEFFSSNNSSEWVGSKINMIFAINLANSTCWEAERGAEDE